MSMSKTERLIRERKATMNRNNSKPLEAQRKSLHVRPMLSLLVILLTATILLAVGGEYWPPLNKLDDGTTSSPMFLCRFRSFGKFDLPVVLRPINSVHIQTDGVGNKMPGAQEVSDAMAKRLRRQGLSVTDARQWDAILRIRLSGNGLVILQAFRSIIKDGPMLQVWGEAIVVPRSWIAKNEITAKSTRASVLARTNERARASKVFRQELFDAIYKLTDDFASDWKKCQPKKR